MSHRPKTSLHRFFAVPLLAAGTIGLFAPKGVLAAPAQHTVTLNEYLGSDWSDELIHETITFKPGQLNRPDARVIGSDRKEIAAQVTHVQRYDDGSIRSMNVWFKAALPANGKAVYTIQPGTASKAPSGVTVKTDQGSITLLTKAPGPIGITLLGGEKTWGWQVPLTDALAPIQTLHLPSGKKAGKSRFNVPFKIKSYRSRIVNQGPLFVDVQIDYQFDAGFWRFEARVLAGCPMIQIREKYNTGNSGQRARLFDRFYDLVLNAGEFKPTQGWYSDNGPAPRHFDLAKSLMPKSWIQRGVARPSWSGIGVNGYTLSYEENRDDYFLIGWPTGQPGIGVIMRLVEPGGDAIALAALDIEQWRNPQSLRLHTNKDGEVIARLPLQKYKQEWAVDGFRETSPNYTGITLFVPPNQSCRSYGIMLSTAEDEREARLESVLKTVAHLDAEPLDLTRRWVIDWPDPMAGAKWAEKPSPAGEKALQIMRNRTELARLGGDLVWFDMGFHFHFNRSVHPQIDKVLNDDAQLTADQRKEFRRLVAFEAYRQNSHQQLPWGSGVHLSNPNKAIMAIEARAKTAQLVRDHPQFNAWSEVTINLLRTYIRKYTFDSGAPYENPHYTLGVTLEWSARANDLLIEAGIGDALDTELFKKCMRFVINTWLTPPDPRFNGYRMVMPIGNCSYQSIRPEFGTRYVNYFKDRDPALAGQLQWLVNQTLPDEKKIKIVDDIKPAMHSKWIKDYGVVFRHGYGTKYETYMHMLAGKCFGHYELGTDHMAYSIYAKGQPISLHFGNGYFPIYNRPWLRNRISFDMKVETHERTPFDVKAATFSPEIEYLRAVRETRQLLTMQNEYPKLDERGIRWLPEESANFRATMAGSDAPENFMPLTLWHRQMLLLKDADPKGPNYFVVRDGFGGRPTKSTDLSMWFLANTMTQAGGVFHFDGQCDVDMDVFVGTPTPGSFKIKTDKYGHVQQPYGRFTGFDPKYFPDGKRREDQLLLRIRQPAGRGYLVVLYPRLKNADPPATYQRLSDSVVRVKTQRSTDIVYVDFDRTTYTDDDISIDGRAGAIRRYTSGKIVIANSEGPCTVAVAGKKIVGSGSFVVEIDGPTHRITHRADGAQVTIK